MTEEPMLNLMRAIRGDIAGLKADMVEIKQRLGALEAGQASLQRRLDRVVSDADAIRRRVS